MALPAERGIQGGFFAPLHRDEFYNILTERYNAARSEAARVAGKENIDMKVEYFKPVHFGAGFTSLLYQLPTGVTTKTLLQNTAFFPWGIQNLDSCFDRIAWWQGAGVKYIGEMFTLPVFYYQEHQGAWKGNLLGYEFRGGETFRFEVHCFTSPMPDHVDAWLHAWIVLPSTQSGTLITTA